MSLNLDQGEIISGVGGPYSIPPRNRWMGSQFFEEARQKAIEAFQQSGAMLPVVIDPESVLVQEYTASGRLAFIFQRIIAGKEHFYPYVFTIPPDMLRELRVTGRWGK